MSCINIRAVQSGTESEAEMLGHLGLDPTDDPNQSYTDGESLFAACSILGLLDDLENGEALVITRVRW